jgi:hypothetical protein
MSYRSDAAQPGRHFESRARSDVLGADKSNGRQRDRSRLTVHRLLVYSFRGKI